MSAENTASLTVVKSELAGCVYSQDGTPLRGAKVACSGMETITLFDGSFIFRDLKPGTYQVRASLQGFQSTSKNVSLREGEKKTLDIHLPKAVGTAKICGYVYDEAKKIIMQGGTIILVLPIANRYVSVNREGYFEFEGLPAGTYLVSTSIQGYEDEDVLLSVADGELKKHDFFCKAKKIEDPPWG